MGVVTDGRTQVLLVAEDGGAGGIGRYCVDLAEAIGEDASVACLCSRPCDGVGGCWLSARCRERGVPLETLPMPPKAWHVGLRALVAHWRQRGRPLVHVNGRRGNAIVLAARLGGSGLRYVTTVHGVLGLHSRRNAIYRMVDVVAARGSGAVIAVSVDTQRRLVRAGIPPGRIHVIPNALSSVDVEVLRESARTRVSDLGGHANERPVRVGFLGRLSPEKGVRELAELATRLRARGAHATVTVGGDGPEVERFLRETATLRTAGSLIYRGAVADAGRFMREIDILVIPSHNEGMPYVLLEAMASGCAVVGFAVGGLPEVITDPSLGVLAPAGDVEALTVTVHDLVADPARVSAMGASASRHVAEHYALDSRLPLLERAYGIHPAPPTRGPAA